MRAMMWFTRDLRVDDQPALRLACEADMLLCVFVVEPRWFRQTHWQSKPMGAHRWRFLWQSLMALDQRLRQYGQRLHIAWGDPAEKIPALVHSHGIHHLFVSRQPGTEEDLQRENIRAELGDTRFLHVLDTGGAFQEKDLPFPLLELPATFSQFRRRIEKAQCPPQAPVDEPPRWPPPPGLPEDERGLCPPLEDGVCPLFDGGETPAWARLQHYLFDTHRIARYKETRNALDDAEASSRLSPWLAHGTLSVRRLAQELARYEREHQRNDSTYWLWFELLWREYFHWYGLCHHERLFQGRGVNRSRQQTTFYPHRFLAWTQGNTQWPLINACMNQLRETGYLSNRGRQIVASCFVNELGLDWRFGAAWFQECLVDYDVGSNWGNWQYLAGVGADPKGKRQFNLEKQQQQFDPDSRYITRWRGYSDNVTGLHTVDAADWPIDPNTA